MKNLLVLISLFLTLAGCSNIPTPKLHVESIPVAKAIDIKTENPTLAVTEKPLITRAKLVAIGDILLHQSVYLDAATPEGTYNFSPMFEKVKPFLENADITVANQEERRVG